MRVAGLSGQLKRRRGSTTIRVQGVRTAPDLVERDFNPTASTACGARTSPTSGHGRAGCTWLGDGLLQPADRRLGDRRSPPHGARRRRARDGRRSKAPRARRDPPLRPGLAIHVAAVHPALPQVGIEVSMGSRGDCFDNAVLESFHAPLRRTLSTAAPGRPRPKPGPRSSTTSKRSTIAAVVTRRSGCSPPATTKRTGTTPTLRDSAATRLAPKQDINTTTNGRQSRLDNPCPPNRGRSSAHRGGACASTGPMTWLGMSPSLLDVGLTGWFGRGR